TPRVPPRTRPRSGHGRGEDQVLRGSQHGALTPFRLNNACNHTERNIYAARRATSESTDGRTDDVRARSGTIADHAGDAREVVLRTRVLEDPVCCACGRDIDAEPVGEREDEPEVL